jgi:Arc/MetJ-type ribon-helix-helix transcriptional regulator
MRKIYGNDSMASLDNLCQSLTLSVCMKAVTINISLNPDLAEFARSDSEAHAFGSMSEYMRDLIRHRRQERIEADVALLEKAIKGAPAGDPADEEIREIVKTQRRIRMELKRARRI